MPHFSPNWKIYIDTGGTFTDCLATDQSGILHRCKVLSSSAIRGIVLRLVSKSELIIQSDDSVPDDFFTGFTLRFLSYPDFSVTVKGYSDKTQTLSLHTDIPIRAVPGDVIELQSPYEAPVLAARLITSTPAGEPLPPLEMRLSTTKATNALLERKGAKTLFLITEGFSDLLLIGNQQRPNLFELNIRKARPFYDTILPVPERIDASGNIINPLYSRFLTEKILPLLKDFEAVAVCLMHSTRNQVHERMISDYLKENGVKHISLSSELSSLMKIVPRAITTDVNATLSPVMESYLHNVKTEIQNSKLHIMSSAGSLTGSAQYRPKDSLLSGPAGGVSGAVSVGLRSDHTKLITFDMGGTSTDVARYDNTFDYRYEHSVGDATLQSPALSIETVAAGGGSICDFDGVSLTVGPESAGAEPGPACYGAGGPLTITDVNLLAGRLDPSNFHFPVNIDAAKDAFHEIFHRVRDKRGDSVSGTEILDGFLDIANEKMAAAISAISTARGFDPSEYTMVSFGGAGGQHATAVASKLGIRKIIVPQDAGLLSAFGLQQSLIRKIETLQCLSPLSETEAKLPELFYELYRSGLVDMSEEGLEEDQITVERKTVFLRLSGQESTLEIDYNPSIDLQETFRAEYERIYNHWIDDRDIEVESIRMIVSEIGDEPAKSVFQKTDEKPVFQKLRSIDYRGGRTELPVYNREDLKGGTSVQGPALVLDPYSTLFTEPGWQMEVQSDLTIILNRDSGDQQIQKRDDVINLQLYTNRFSAIAEQMGEMLRRTAISVNVKERLDFSCALLDSDGYLIVNAPHIPVHLGAMGSCVRSLLKKIEMDEGDVIVTNHPAFGGSHLPDVTVVTPVFFDGKRIGFTASRAHHSEIGGKRPGSMPPDATNLAEEGVVIEPMYLIKDGKSRLDEIKKKLSSGKWPSRSVNENMADLQAAVAANHFGMKQLQEMAGRFGVNECTRYMQQLKVYAAERMRLTLKALTDKTYTATELMDDGSKLCVNGVKQEDRLTINFEGTSGVHEGNLNANPSIVNSVVMYVLRLMVDEPLPLNDGLLEPVEVIIPEGMLNPVFYDDPERCPAVVGGNIETSQRLTDTLLKAFVLAACSQGTMNNVLFGNDRFGYYETVAGGTGAGDGFNGAHSVHQHMTNTRATDPEVLEHRYPVRLDNYSIRPNSGGNGKWKGGNGVIRELTFLEPVSLSVLSQHRVVQPYGLKGGEAGMTGINTIKFADGTTKELSWKDGDELKTGDRFILHTPGGGGFGE
jgi:5-oxoprolinase (ATP-hydrolysing)